MTSGFSIRDDTATAAATDTRLRLLPFSVTTAVYLALSIWHRDGYRRGLSELAEEIFALPVTGIVHDRSTVD